VLLVLIRCFTSALFTDAIAAYLVEAFPARISVQRRSPFPNQHRKRGFGWLVALIGRVICARTKISTPGLVLPDAVAALTLVIGTLVLKEPRGH